jgi:hypothetical protein
MLVAGRAVVEAGQSKKVPQWFPVALLFKDIDMKDKFVTFHIGFHIFTVLIVQFVDFWVGTLCRLVLSVLFDLAT